VRIYCQSPPPLLNRWSKNRFGPRNESPINQLEGTDSPESAVSSNSSFYSSNSPTLPPPLLGRVRTPERHIFPDYPSYLCTTHVVVKVEQAAREFLLHQCEDCMTLYRASGTVDRHSSGRWSTRAPMTGCRPTTTCISLSQLVTDCE
jgi:hypothetical protein